MICSTPRAPSFTGTPTNRSWIPYSPCRKTEHGRIFFLSLRIGFDHLGRGRSRRVPGARADHLGDLQAAARGALADRVDLLRRQARIVRQRDAGDRRVARKRHHRVAVAAEHERVDVLDRHARFHGDERAHARRVEHARHADDALPGELAQPVDRLAHRVERVGHRDDDRVRRVLHDLLGHRLHDLEVDVQQIVAAHPRLARHAGRDDDDVGAGRRGPALVIGAVADHARVRSLDRAGLEHVERDPGRLLVGDVDDDDVGELLVGNRARHRGADGARATDDCHFSVHEDSSAVSRRL